MPCHIPWTDCDRDCEGYLGNGTITLGTQQENGSAAQETEPLDGPRTKKRARIACSTALTANVLRVDSCKKLKRACPPPVDGICKNCISRKKTCIFRHRVLDPTVGSRWIRLHGKVKNRAVQPPANSDDVMTRRSGHESALHLDP